MKVNHTDSYHISEDQRLGSASWCLLHDICAKKKQKKKRPWALNSRGLAVREFSFMPCVGSVPITPDRIHLRKHRDTNGSHIMILIGGIPLGRKLLHVKSVSIFVM